jgi:DNA-directed RNA polymerase subunit RPC12/RpoP/tetratricopeptide (TPR) repeat protein
MTETFSCPACSAPLIIASPKDLHIRCPYCGSTVVVPPELRPAPPPSSVTKHEEKTPDLATLVQLSRTSLEAIRLYQSGRKEAAIDKFVQAYAISSQDSERIIQTLISGKTLHLLDLDGDTLQVTPPFDRGELENQISTLIALGDRPQAIQRYHELTGESWTLSKEAVDACAGGAPLPLPPDLPANPSTANLSQADKALALGIITQLAESGQLEEAISLYREVFDVSRTEAQAAIDRLANGVIDEVANNVLLSPYVSMAEPPSIDYAPWAEVVSTGTAAAGTGCALSWIIIGVFIVTLLIVMVPITAVLASSEGPLWEFWNRLKPFGANHLSLAFGEEGSGAGYFSDPRTIAVDPVTGNIYVGEYEGGRVQAFTSQGIFLTQWRAENPKQYLQSLAVDRRGNLYEVIGGRLLIRDSASGSLMGEILALNDYGHPSYFEDVAVTPEGGLVAIVDSETLLRYDAQGKLIQTIPDAVSRVSGDSELEARVAVDGRGNIYVLGIFNDAVFAFSPQGQFRNRIGSEGDEAGQFQAPSSIAIDNQGLIYVGDMDGILVFNPDGRYQRTIAVPGFPFGMAFNDINQLFVVTNTPRVLRLEEGVD